jgi:hypothetical protein
MATILELIQEKSTYMFLADGLTQEHQQSVKLDLLRKIDNLQSQINNLEASEGKISDENSALPIPDVSVRYYCCSDCNAKFDTKTWKPYWLKNAKHTIGRTSKICKGNFKEVNEQEFNAH